MGKKDISEKRLEKFNDVFADIYNNLVFHGKQLLNSEDLTDLPTESFSRRNDGSIRQGNRDICKADSQSQRYRLILGLENQEQCDRTMPVRTMGYDYASYEEQIKQLQNDNQVNKSPAYARGIHDNQQLTPVLTTVLFFGKHWNGPKSLHELLYFPTEQRELFQQLVPDYRFQLICVRELPRTVIDRLTSDFRLIAEFLASAENPVMRKRLRYNTSHMIQHPEEFIDLLNAITKDSRYLTIKEQITTQRKDITMCAILDEWENYGRKRGIAQGRRQGRRQGKKQGRKIGEQHMLERASRMVQGGDSDLIPKLRQDPALLQEMYRKYSLEYTKV